MPIEKAAKNPMATRAEAPVARIKADGYEPFWAITKHADVMQIAAQPERFSSAAGITLAREGTSPVPPTEILVMIDPPKHGPMRRVVNSRFTPRANALSNIRTAWFAS